MNNAVFGKNITNKRRHKAIKLVENKKRRNYLISDQNYHTKYSIWEDSLAIKKRKQK